MALELPARRSFGGREWNVVVSYLPTLPGLLNVHASNLLFGWIQRAAGLSRHHELTIGWIPTTAVLFLATAVLLAKRRIQVLLRPAPDQPDADQQAERETLFLLLALSTLLATFAGCKTAEGHSPWRLIHAFVPGMDAMRAVSRIHVFLTFPAALTAAFGAERFLKMVPHRVVRAIAALVLCALAALSCTWKNGVHAKWSADWARKVLQAVPAPPEGCALFAVEDSGKRPAFRHPFEYQLAAWEIANRWDRPTLNGYSGQAPMGWTMNGAVGRTLRPKTELWIQRHGLNDVCIYDWGTNTWRMASSRRQ